MPLSEIIFNISMRKSFSWFMLEFIIAVWSYGGIKNLIVNQIIDKVIHLFLESNKESLYWYAKGSKLFFVLENNYSHLKLFVWRYKVSNLIVNSFEDLNLGEISLSIMINLSFNSDFKLLYNLFQSDDFLRLIWFND